MWYLAGAIPIFFVLAIVSCIMVMWSAKGEWEDIDSGFVVGAVVTTTVGTMVWPLTILTAVAAAFGFGVMWVTKKVMQRGKTHTK